MTWDAYTMSTKADIRTCCLCDLNWREVSLPSVCFATRSLVV